MNPQLVQALAKFKGPFRVGDDTDSVVDTTGNCIAYTYGFDSDDFVSATIVAQAIADFLNSQQPTK